MRPTRSAIAVLMTGGVCWTIGRIFGELELYLAAGVCLATVLGAAIYVAVLPLRIATRRDVEPEIVRVGSITTITVTIVNRGWISSPSLKAKDFFGSSILNFALVTSIRPKDSTTLEYKVPVRDRGLVSLGPCELQLTDPFNLMRTKIHASAKSQLLVRPRRVALSPITATPGRFLADDATKQRSGSEGDEFVRLRPYVVGDELRRVSWRASAKHGELIVRQTEETRRGSVNVLLDLRRSSYTDAGFERALTATVSVLTACLQTADELRFATTSSAPISLDHQSALDAVDVNLASLQPTPDGSLAEAASRMLRSGNSGRFIFICGGNDAECDQLLSGRRARSNGSIAVLCDKPESRPQCPHIQFDDSADLSFAWDSMFESGKL